MHPEAREGLARMFDASGLDTRYPWVALDLGGRDINGGIRDLLPLSKWIGIDIEPGPGVDFVHDCTRPWPTGAPLAEVIVCTEVLEHVAAWREIIYNASQALVPQHAFGVFFTAASTGRRPHGASGAMDPAPGEWYRNVPPDELREELEKNFVESTVTYNPNPGDVYAWARGPRARPFR